MLNKAVLPRDWDTTTIGVSCDILDHMRIPVNSSDRFERKGDIPYYGANGLQGWIDDYIFDEELVLLAEDGGYFNEFENRPIAYMVRGKSWVNNHAHVLRARKQIATNHWIFYNLVHKDIQYYIQGGTRSKLNQSELRNIEVPLPPLTEQRRIAEILDTIDKAIQKTEALISKLKAMKQGMLHDLLTRGLDKNGKLRDLKTHPEQFKDSPLWRIPKEWILSRIINVASIKYGISDAIDQTLIRGVPTITLPCVSPLGELTLDKDLMALTDPGKLSPHDFLQPGDLLFNWRNGSREHLGKTAYYNGNGEHTHVGFLLRVRTDPKKCRSRYLWRLLCFMKAKGFFLAAKGQVNNTFNSTELADVRIILPSINEQLTIDSVLESHDSRIRTEEQYRDKLKLQKKGLMYDLLTGKIRVRI